MPPFQGCLYRGRPDPGALPWAICIAPRWGLLFGFSTNPKGLPATQDLAARDCVRAKVAWASVPMYTACLEGVLLSTDEMPVLPLENRLLKQTRNMGIGVGIVIGIGIE